MGTTILDDSILGVYVKRFYGGKDRGVCYSIRIDRELEEHQMIALINELKALQIPYKTKEADG